MPARNVAVGILVVVCASVARAEAPVEYAECVNGPALGVAAGNGAYGYQLTPGLGGRVGCLESRDAHRWLWQWDASAELAGGWLANTRPFNHLIGVRGGGDAMLGYRFSPEAALSPYVEGAVLAAGRAMTQPDTGFSALDTINNLDGIGGVSADGAIRAGGGLSLLEGTRSLRLLGFLQATLRGPRTFAPGRVFGDLGARVQFDLAESWRAAAEGRLGYAPSETDDALATTTSFGHWALAGDVRKRFGAHFWLAFGASLSRDFYTVTTVGSPHVYEPAEQIDVEFDLHAGYAL